MEFSLVLISASCKAEVSLTLYELNSSLPMRVNVDSWCQTCGSWNSRYSIRRNMRAQADGHDLAFILCIICNCRLQEQNYLKMYIHVRKII
jgi:formate dehydrogenase maturation protein FdhE